MGLTTRQGQGSQKGTEVNQVGDLKDVGYLFPRSKFIEQFFKLIPRKTFYTSKKISLVEEGPPSGVLLHIEDRTSEKVDILVGGDSVHSKVRKNTLKDDPTCAPIFSQQYFCVALVSMEVKQTLPKKCSYVYCQYA